MVSVQKIAVLSIAFLIINTYATNFRIIKNFLPVACIPPIEKDIDRIEAMQVTYKDYSGRLGAAWTDGRVRKANPASFVEEYNSRKVTAADAAEQEVQERYPQSITHYPALLSAVCDEALPRMIRAVEELTGIKLPDEIDVQIFFQRCSTSDAMGWHQDPGEEYPHDAQALCSMVVALTDQDDPVYGWRGGEFKIRPGLPESSYNQEEVTTITHAFNQAVIFDNRENSHSVTPVIPKTVMGMRDLLIILLYDRGMPKEKFKGG
jgi:hypothetical protein